MAVEKKKRIVVAVINDLATDQRVHRTCTWLHDNGFNVLLVGRKLKTSLPLHRPYATKRFCLPFTKGAAFYAVYNIRLFFFLLLKKHSWVWANDLDTLPACYYSSKIRKTRIIYDSHEYFTGVPELQNRPRVRKVWKFFEKAIFPKLPLVFTVNDSIATLYEKEYTTRPLVLRNVPFRLHVGTPKKHEELKIPEGKNIIILQGSGINVRRGGEEAVAAMRLVENAVLLVIGSGDVIQTLHQMRDNDPVLRERVFFFGKMPYSEMMSYTAMADIGLTLDKPDNINYLYSLPNKLFDYIQAGIAVLASDLPELRRIIELYGVGKTIGELTPESIAAAINQMLSDRPLMEMYKASSLAAADVLCWENEQQVLKKALSDE